MVKHDDFDQFYAEVTGHDPFPWQREYAMELCTDGWPQSTSWSDHITKPTGAGKTKGILLPWLFATAHQLDRDLRTLPLRLFWTVDRRIIVDTVHRLGIRILDALSDSAPGSACHRVGQALLKTGARVPFQIVKMRGGVFMDPDWMTDPRTPTLISTTVDQVGSALLFRKYGARDRLWPVYAGMVANESAIVLDESHLSQPFVETLESIKRQHREGLFLIQVSATCRKEAPALLKDADLQHPVLGPRLRQAKVAELVPCQKEGNLAKTLAKEAKKLGAGDMRVVAVVCNRVKTARETFNLLRKDGKSDAVLFTGRSRQFDRDRLTDELLPYIETNPDRPSRARTLYIVATQCIEVGADFDFDAMATECAPFDCLVQRAGRLGRLGDRDVELVVVQGGPDDPVYEGQAVATWEWLARQQPVNFSWEGQERLAAQHGDELDALMSPSQEAPSLSSDVVRTLSRTNPSAMNAPTVERFLHGYDRSPDVTVVWRGDLPPDDPEKDHLAQWAPTVALCPPSPGEGLDLPVWTLRAFLKSSTTGKSNGKPDDVADVALAKVPDHDRSCPCKPVLRWKGTPEESEILTNLDDLRPGDILVLPVSRGGCDEFGWTGDATTEPEDLADKVLHKAGKMRLRIHPALTGNSNLEEEFKEVHRRFEKGDKLDEAFVQGLLEHLPLGEHLRGPRACVTWEPYPDGKGIVVADPRYVRRPPRDSNDASRTRRQVLLNDHLQDVGRWARIYAENLLADTCLVSDLEFAGLLHDLGKADPRWQEYIYGGRRTPGDPVVAKAVFQTNWNRAGLPEGLRHEFSSLMITDEGGLRSQAHDQALVAHLLATHHGLGRPFAPPLYDHAPVSYSYEDPTGKTLTVESSAYPYAKVDSGWADRYAAIMRRHGPWEIAYLETLLRLADWRASAEERKSTDA